MNSNGFGEPRVRLGKIVHPPKEANGDDHVVPMEVCESGQNNDDSKKSRRKRPTSEKENSPLAKRTRLQTQTRWPKK